MNNRALKKFIRENSVLFWWIKEEDKENISVELLVETILNYGDEISVKRLFELVGIKKVSRIFYKQTSGKRKNYHPKTINFYNLYFRKNA